MNDTVMQRYAEYLQETGDKSAAASLTLAAVMVEQGKTAAPPPEQPMTVPEVARLLRVRQTKVLTWVHSGRLLGFNVTTKESGRPKYRIHRKDLEDFVRLRTEVQAPRVGRPVGSRSVPKRVETWSQPGKANRGPG